MNQTQDSSSSQQSTQSINGLQRNATQGASAGGQSNATGPVGQVFPTRNYLSESVRTASISALTQCLADLTTINMQLKTAHWNVKGPNFYQLHELFEDLTAVLEPAIDEVAERISALGGRPPGTVHEVAQTTTVAPFPRDAFDGLALVGALADRMATLGANLAQQIEMADQQGDPDTADLLNEVSREVSKSLWFLEAHLQSAPVGAAGQQ
ncbi:DNA starvation/stationary phase protection protein Dps [Halosimplex aquaticum]|uniref:DNA starvation/stationary phase protection protein Dps n=1 Tax=Halosimplex aquaticum TaxID=3026162 RepID=A0ABD5Y6H1_9EURY